MGGVESARQSTARLADAGNVYRDDESERSSASVAHERVAVESERQVRDHSSPHARDLQERTRTRMVGAGPASQRVDAALSTDDGRVGQRRRGVYSQPTGGSRQLHEEPKAASSTGNLRLLEAPSPPSEQHEHLKEQQQLEDDGQFEGFLCRFEGILHGCAVLLFTCN